MELKFICTEFSVKLDTGSDIRNVTAEFSGIVWESGISQGTLAANVIGSTGSLTTIEYERA